MEGSSQPAAAEPGGEPPVKRCRVEGEASVIDLTGAGSSQEEVEGQGRPSGPAPQPGQLLESQRLLAKAAELRKQVADGQAAREAAAAAAEVRRQAAAASIERAAPHVAAAEQRAREDAQAALESARSSIEAAAAAIMASAEQQAALSRALGQDGGAVQRQLERARAAAVAAAAAAKERLEGEVQEAVKTARARAEVAYGVVKAKREAAAAEAAAEASIAGWPAERCRLLQEAARLEQQAVPVVELEAQRGSALVQALATSGCLPLIAGCLGEAADKVRFALSCKALLRQYRQDQVAWLRGLHVSLSGDVAACEQQLQLWLQRVPPGSIASLSLVQQGAYDKEGALIAVTSALHQGLQALDI
ncbi:hypothetical protein C2E21_8134 [Chlorella sorokiniana]|uniref:Uncharacterized protein n=1 Tax=Chlorella sorokiniana TaxID=3076 RepID=A0A2P6TFK6_CHLSO|nr:hypothetical protein C2E21_8134 [Chlorella sorokiniana]|eukprot:PRW32879.1 hypothetical protein C2E21_8134 [Chlorella sorokiniana]